MASGTRWSRTCRDHDERDEVVDEDDDRGSLTRRRVRGATSATTPSVRAASVDIALQPCVRTSGVDGEVDEHGRRHAEERGEHRERGPATLAQRATEVELALRLESDDEEEERHEFELTHFLQVHRVCPRCRAVSRDRLSRPSLARSPATASSPTTERARPMQQHHRAAGLGVQEAPNRSGEVPRPRGAAGASGASRVGQRTQGHWPGGCTLVSARERRNLASCSSRSLSVSRSRGGCGRSFRRYSTVPNHSGVMVTPPVLLLDQPSRLQRVVVELIPGFLTDHYDGQAKALRLAEPGGARAQRVRVGQLGHQASADQLRGRRGQPQLPEQADHRRAARADRAMVHVLPDRRLLVRHPALHRALAAVRGRPRPIRARDAPGRDRRKPPCAGRAPPDGLADPTESREIQQARRDGPRR